MPAPTIEQITLADEPSRWSAFGFTLAGECCLLGSVSVQLAGERPGSGISRWSLREIDTAELDGLPTAIGEQPAPAPAGEHPNGVIAIDHVVAITPQLDRTVAALQRAGLDLRRVREEPTPAGAPRQAFFRLGEVILEVVQEPENVVHESGGAERPAHFWGLALLCADLERTAAAFEPHLGMIRDAVQPGRRIATVKRSAGLAVPLALMSAATEAVG
ncbi:MAG TPA: hypothetical protein VKG82_08410 [Solirubrobacteraceae bacterium]|nr:hypothetical protein [Solirubrobacteraceae bacterium]